MLRVTLLGAFLTTHGDVTVAVPGARLRGLLVRLALAGGRGVEQDVLVDAIWADDPPADPAHALQSLVSPADPRDPRRPVRVPGCWSSWESRLRKSMSNWLDFLGGAG